MARGCFKRGCFKSAELRSFISMLPQCFKSMGLEGFKSMARGCFGRIGGTPARGGIGGAGRYDVAAIVANTCICLGGADPAYGVLRCKARRGVLFRGVGWDEAGALMRMLGERPYATCMLIRSGTDFRAPGAADLAMTPAENAMGGRDARRRPARPRPLPAGRGGVFARTLVDGRPIEYDGGFAWTEGEAVAL